MSTGTARSRVTPLAAFLGLLAVACGGSGGGTSEADEAGGTGDADGKADDAFGRADAGDGGDPLLVRIESGLVRGAREDDVLSWKGIPYAAAPVGDLRWRSPEPPPPWEGVRDATVLGPQCLQRGATLTGPLIGDPDCLSLNVWRPLDAGDGPLPVIVFVHGGGWKEGTSNIPLYDGANLALRGSVVVTLNYRLGPLGFLALRGLAAESGGTTGNYGLLDQIAALEWVQENAAAFGGDPARVLFWGQSAGAWSALIHATSPRSAGLFSRAFSDSGGPYVRGLERATADGVVYADALGCPAVPGRIECLRAKSDEEIVMPAPSGGWSPVIDGIVIEEPIMAALEAGHHVDIPFLVLNTANEFTRMEANPPVDSIASAADYEAAIAQRFGDGAEAVLAQYPVLSFATPRDAYLAVLNDANMSCANRRITRALAATQTAPVFRTVWDHIDSGGALQHLGATHGADLRYWFANFGGMFEPTDEELALSDAMGSFLTSFAATGDPDRTGADGWPAHDAATDALLLLDVDLTTIDGYRTAACDFWDGLAPGLGD